MNRKILAMVIVLLSATLLVSPLIGPVAACREENEEKENREIKAVCGARAWANQTFSIMQISDTQHLAWLSPTLYSDTTSWIVNNSASYNLKMVVHTGDFIDQIGFNASQRANEWTNANASMSNLLNAGIPYCWDAGNHDQTPFYNSNGTMMGSSYLAFNATYMRSKPYWVSDIFDSKNTAVKFNYNNYPFMVINLELYANASAIAWMKDLLDKNLGVNTIVATHGYLNDTAGYIRSITPTIPITWPDELKKTLDNYSNVFLVLCGHFDGWNMTRAGNREEILFDRQGPSNSTGAASVRIYTFDLTNKQVNASTYCLDTKTWLIDAYNQFSFPVNLISDLDYHRWILVNKGTALKAYPDLREYVWQKNASMEPNGLYDKIGLHRVVKLGAKPKGAVFILPGLYGNGENLVSNPPSDNFTKTEDKSSCLYWANRGFDVYTIDFRYHFIPVNFNKSQLAFTADWGMEQFMSDIKEAVDKAKEISGDQRVFMGGLSQGGTSAQIYAARYWQQDLRGLILLDAAPQKSTLTKNQNLTNSYNLTAVVDTIKKNGAWVWENPQKSAVPSPLNPGYVFLLQFAAQNPGAPAQYLNGTLIKTINPRTNKTWTNITEWFEYSFNIALQFNTYGGYSDITYDMNMGTGADRYFPIRYFIDYLAMADWAVCPYVAYDYLAHVNEVNVPVIGFRSGLNLAAYGNYTNGMATTDFTWTVLPNYGHGDVFYGTYSGRDVSEPAYQWMLSHRMLVGEGRLVIDNVRYKGDMVILINATTIDARVDGKSSSWNITEHHIFHHLEVYEGEGMLGRIKININKGCAVANGPRVHFLGRIV
jgi:pimeloyl-ACP methyl ester carboxylesterase